MDDIIQVVRNEEPSEILRTRHESKTKVLKSEHEKESHATKRAIQSRGRKPFEAGESEVMSAQNLTREGIKEEA